MITSNILSTFHHWFLASLSGPVGSRAVVLHGDPRFVTDGLISEIAAYLDEYDDDEDGGWLAATSDLVLQISRSPESRKLIRMADPCPSCPPDGPCGIRKTLNALGALGHVVLRADVPKGKSLDLIDAFHVGIGEGFDEGLKCHLVLNPDLVSPSSIAHIVGDMFLDSRHEARETKAPEGG